MPSDITSTEKETILKHLIGTFGPIIIENSMYRVQEIKLNGNAMVFVSWSPREDHLIGSNFISADAAWAYALTCAHENLEKAASSLGFTLAK